MKLFLSGVLPAAAAASVLVLVTWWGVGRLRDWALRQDLLDRPNARSSHARPTPRLGGLAILMAVSLPGLLWSTQLGDGQRAGVWTLLFLLGLAVGLVSLWDDLRGLPALVRLGMHLAVACGVLKSAGTLASLALPDGLELPLGAADWPLSLLWIVGCINAFNFMDGIDGIAGGQALVLGLAWLAIGVCLPSTEFQVLGLLLASGALGFLVHNWAPATIFMGDVGSAFLGYWAAVVPFVAPRPGRWLVPALLIIWPFVFDTSLTLLGRVWRGEAILSAHRGHIYQRLVRTGLSHAQVALFYVALAGSGAVTASLAALDRTPEALWAAALVPVGALLLLAALTWRERGQSIA